ncbi:hypothetical protein BJ912DRAFT_1057459 [Pholiota molesta]|nr:hypothetical protein BJ912DRAFT_1057459 [Pholiota molesta]
MLRLAAVRRYSPATVRWSRLESTAPTTTIATTSELPPTPAAEGDLPAATQGRRRAKAKAKAVQDVVVARPQKDWKELGLKYDPDTLPVVQTLDPNLAPFTEEDYAMTLIHGRSVHKPFFHPRTHDIPVANIHFRSHHVRFLNLFTHFASHAASALGIPASQVKSQENFERKVHKRAIKAWDAHPQVVQRWITYLRTHAMPGVGMKVITWERAPLGIGASHLKKEAKGQVLTPSKKIEALGKKIVVEETVSQTEAQQQA